MKKSVLSLLACLAVCSVCAQTQKEMIDAIVESSSQVSTMSCRFEQTKRMDLLDEEIKSYGRMDVKMPDCLRWEYEKPYSYLFQMNGHKLLMDQSGGRRDVVDLASNQMFQMISRIIMDSMTGQCLRNTQLFDVKMESVNGEWQALLNPRQKEIRSLFSKLCIAFDATTHTVRRVVMFETSGDTTLIEISGTQLNIPLDEKIFAID